MQVSLLQFKNGIIKFIDDVIMPRSTPTQKFALTFYILANQNKVDTMIKSLGILNERDEFDLDQVFDYAHQALEKAGGVLIIPQLNWNFDKDDLTKIYNILKGDNVYGT